MHPPARRILLTTAAVALLGAAGSASAAVTTDVADGRLVVTGDDAENIVVLRTDPEAGAIVVDSEGASASYDAKSFAGISVAAGAGDDVVTVAGALGQRLIVDGGAGSDVLLGGSDDEALDGGDGDDVLDAGDGDDSLTGGAGADVLTCGEGFDVVFGRASEDTAGDDCEKEQSLIPTRPPGGREPAPPVAAPPAPPVAIDAGGAAPQRALTRAEIIAASIRPGFAEPVVRATRKGMTVQLRNTGVANLNVRITASEFAAGKAFGYRPVFKRLAPGASAKVKLVAPKKLARLIQRRKRLRRVAVVTVVNAESNAERTVEKRLR